MTDRRTVYFNIALFALLIVGYLVVNFRGETPESSVQGVSFESAGLDRPLAPLDPARKPMSLKDYRGAPILLHFWASWCEPCRRDEAPLRELFASTHGRGTRFVMVASEDNPDAIRKAARDKEYPGDTYVETSGNLARAFSVKSYPYTILLDREGRVLFRGEGPLSGENQKRLKDTLAELARGVLPAFSFPDSAGGKLSSESLADKVWVADFIFTSCGDTCPMISEKVRAVQESFGSDPRFRIVSFSVDPKNDLPEKLQAFGKEHGANPATWRFLRPSQEELKSLMVEGFQLGTAESPRIHSAKIFVVRPGNVVEANFDGDAPDAVAKLKARVAVLLGAAGT